MDREQLAARLRASFIIEVEELVSTMNTDLLTLEKHPADVESLRSLFRVLHTMKGAARAAGVGPFEQVCHLLESRLSDARDGKNPLGPDDFALLFPAADALEEARGRLKAGGDLAGSPLDKLLKRVERGARPRKRKPAPEEAPAVVPRRERQDGLIRVEAEKLDTLLAAMGELLVAGSRVAGRPLEVQAFHDLATRSAITWQRAGRGIRVALERAGASPSLLQELTRLEESLRGLAHDSGRLAADSVADARMLAHATDEMADRVHRLRMRPFGEACEALPRAVRDLATESGKEVDFEVLGSAVEVDRAVLNGLRDALLHLVRNAVDHGIEVPAARVRAGKASRGRLTVGAALTGGRLLITVADDGAGLDRAAIRTQLERRGLPVPDDDRDLARALFEPGFSTRAEVGAISGRGVGLDAVRDAMERIRGTVQVTGKHGEGTTFVLECPLTLSTIRVLLVSVGTQVAAVPTEHIERLVRLRVEDIRHAEGREVISTPDAPVPLMALARLLPPLVERPASGTMSVVVLAAGGRRLAVVVDELLSEQEVVVRPLGRGGEGLPHLGGAAILGTGRVALVLNTPVLIATALGAKTPPSLLKGQRPVSRGKLRVLVVDDSFTTRTLEQSVLEAAGYEVFTAVDGADAWRLLQERGSDAVVSDVEMPRMDGFGLCATIRASRRFKALPVVLVTALETEEHRARGLEVGADAYLGKSSFDQRSLLETIDQLVGRVGA